MNKKYVFLLLGAVAVALVAYLILGRDSGPAAVVPNSVTLPNNVVRVEGDPWAGYAYFRDPNFLAGTGIDYKYNEELDQAARARRLTEGSINFYVTTMDQVLANKPAGRIVAMIDISLGADAMVFNTRKHSYLVSVDNIPRLVAEMKRQGKKPVLAYSGNTPSDFLLRKLSNTREELRLTDFELVSVDQSATAYKMLQEGKADVAVLWEPDTTSAANEGYTVVLSSKDVPNSIVDVLVASDYVIEHQPDLVQRVVDAMYEARARAIANPRAFTEFIAADGKLEVPQAEKLLQGVYLFDAASADRYMNQRVAPLDETKAFEALETIAGLLNLSDSSITPDRTLIDGRFAARSAQKLR
jgi:ABC-type nitrate/sulfonate/bicarbonate transport system substrate-binding protein